MNSFASSRDFYPILSLRDLLAARDRYHVQLAQLPNVVATAVGKYRIRIGDWYEKRPPWEPRPKDFPLQRGPRNLWNSVVTPWSWPAVMVFVRKWEEPEDLRDRPHEMVPRTLSLPDGRGVPTCVIQMDEVPANDQQAPALNFPKSFIGGGFLVESQRHGRFRYGSVGCLVTDGARTYALTNRHVAGNPNEEVLARLGGERVRVGRTAATAITKRPLDSVYTGFPGTDTLLNLDLGLIEVDDISRWTTQVYGLGPVGEVINLSATNLSLHAIDQPVVAFGAASGSLRGVIVGLFYRYKSMGGTDYVTDVAIATDPDRSTLPGDSGTLWCWPEAVPTKANQEMVSGRAGEAAGGQASEERGGEAKPPILRPLAIQWGGHAAVDSSGNWRKYRSLALATFASTAMRSLDVDLVRGWNTGLPEYWGARGHYSIAFHAIQLLDGRLGRFFSTNLDRITYREADLTGTGPISGDAARFVPLTNVPDEVWKKRNPQQVPGARPNQDNPSHYADMDLPFPEGHPLAGRSLIDAILEDERNLDPQLFWDYYSVTGISGKGLLPFRIWQIFDAMVAARQELNLRRFLAACGVLGHFVGDASQPLHSSYLADGYPAEDGGERRGAGVHSAYETKMVDRYRAAIHDAVAAALSSQQAGSGIESGRAAALSAIRLMADSQTELPPAEIVDAYIDADDTATLWQQLGDRTVARFAAGAMLLATLWQSAWDEGGGDQGIPADALGEISRSALMSLYRSRKFLPSLTLREIAEELGFPAIQT